MPLNSLLPGRAHHGGCCRLQALDGVEVRSGIFSGDNIGLLLLGNAVAFIVALFAIRSFVGFTKHGFRAFGWYRIILGLLLLALVVAGADLNMA